MVDSPQRADQLVDVLVTEFGELMAQDPAAFRRKFRKMAATPFAFYRGSACVYYADLNGVAATRSSTSGPPASGSTVTCTPRTSAPT